MPTPKPIRPIRPIKDSLWVVLGHTDYEGDDLLELVAGPPLAVRKYVLKTYGSAEATLDDFECEPDSATLYRFPDMPQPGDALRLLILPGLPYDRLSIQKFAVTDLLAAHRGENP